MPSADRLAHLDTFLNRVGHAKDQLIEAMHVAQDHDGCLSDEVLLHLARELRLPPSHVYGVATFYHLFTFEPPAEHTCTVCTGTGCFVKDADAIVEAISARHQVTPGTTTSDGRLGLTTARCLGACVLAPLVVLDGQVLADQTPASTLALIEDVLAQPAPDAGAS